MPNVSWEVIDGPIFRRGKRWETGDEMPEAHNLPVFRQILLDARKIKQIGAMPTVVNTESDGTWDPANMTVPEIDEFAAEVDDVPTLIANPFRSGLAGDLVPLAEMARSDVECTLLRSDAIQRGHPPSGNPLFINRSQHDCNHTERNPYFRYEGIRYLGNLVTTHSNVFAVWITVGYFEVQPDTNVPINPDGYQLGQEIGGDQGDIRRHRAFYIIDRTIPVGFELGINHNVDDAIILRRFIE